MPANPTFATALHEELADIEAMLLAKNAAYGDAALSPLRIFSRLGPEEALRVRLDDKLSRIARGDGSGDEDAEGDALGYLVLMRVRRRLRRLGPPEGRG